MVSFIGEGNLISWRRRCSKLQTNFITLSCIKYVFATAWNQTGNIIKSNRYRLHRCKSTNHLMVISSLMVSCISRVIGTDYTCKSTNHLTVISSLMVSCIRRVNNAIFIAHLDLSSIKDFVFTLHPLLSASFSFSHFNFVFQKSPQRMEPVLTRMMHAGLLTFFFFFIQKFNMDASPIWV